jgi:hypothetical protein
MSKELKSRLRRQNIYEQYMAQFLLKLEDRRLILVEEGLQVIRRVLGPLGVLCIAGPKKSGRSFLLEQIIGKRNVFLPQQAQPVSTQGVVIYEQAYDIGSMKVLVLDTQGFDGSDMDSGLFGALYLVASSFIFNSKGVIDEFGLLLLKSCSRVGDYLHSNAAHTQLEALRHTSPRFVWVLRDFQLKFVSEDGTALGATDYMENVLGIPEYQSKFAEKCHQTRSDLIKLFPERLCVACPRPADSQVETVHMEGRELKPKFISQAEEVRAKALLGCPAKRVFGQKYNGRLLSTMLRGYVEAYNSSQPLDLTQAWEKCLVNENTALSSEVKLLYGTLKAVRAEHMPYEEPELINKLYQAKMKALLLIRTAFIKDRTQTERLYEDFEEYFANDLRSVMEENLVSSKHFNMHLLEGGFAEIFSKFDRNSYSDNLSQLEQDWAVAAAAFEEKSRGPSKLEALKEFSEKHHHKQLVKFFRQTITVNEQELHQVVREAAHTKEVLLKTEAEAKALGTSSESIGRMIRDMELLIGVKTPEGLPLCEVLQSILSWLRLKQEERGRLEQETERLREELEEKSRQPPKKSCCALM